MRGFVDFHLYNNFLDYKLTLKRKLTIIRGDSATGKTTMIQMLNDALENGTVSIDCEYKCMVLTDFTWRYLINVEQDCLYFIDEESDFVYTNLFAKMFRESSGYFVIITRKDIESLPYSVNSIYSFKHSGKYITLKSIYSFSNYLLFNTDDFDTNTVVCEDSGSGFEFYKSMLDGKLDVCSCFGKSNVAKFIIDNVSSNKKYMFIVDGASFGSNIGKVFDLCLRNGHNIFIPESFEYILLHLSKFNYLNVLMDEYKLSNVIGSDYVSWEEFFTAELIGRAAGTEFDYSKSHINKTYTSSSVYKQLSKYFFVICRLTKIAESNSMRDYECRHTSIFVKSFN